MQKTDTDERRIYSYNDEEYEYDKEYRGYIRWNIGDELHLDFEIDESLAYSLVSKDKVPLTARRFSLYQTETGSYLVALDSSNRLVYQERLEDDSDRYKPEDMNWEDVITANNLKREKYSKYSLAVGFILAVAIVSSLAVLMYIT